MSVLCAIYERYKGSLKGIINISAISGLRNCRRADTLDLRCYDSISPLSRLQRCPPRLPAAPASPRRPRLRRDAGRWFLRCWGIDCTSRRVRSPHQRRGRFNRKSEEHRPAHCLLRAPEWSLMNRFDSFAFLPAASSLLCTIPRGPRRSRHSGAAPPRRRGRLEEGRRGENRAF